MKHVLVNMNFGETDIVKYHEKRHLQIQLIIMLRVF
jgi:hypothetical protein